MASAHTGAGSAKDDDKLAGMASVLKLAVGAKVMITRNIWTEAGHTNGTAGTLHSVGFGADANPAEDLPLVIMLQVPDYIGPTQWHTDCPARIPIVPIIPVSSRYKTKSQEASRINFPIKLAFAMTIHKSQGLTLDKVLIDIGNREFAPGLSFVAISRVKRLNDLAFQSGFDWRRMQTIGQSGREERLADEDRLYSPQT